MTGLKFYIICEMDGRFPGAPERERFEVPESVYDTVMKGLEIMPGKIKTSEEFLIEDILARDIIDECKRARSLYPAFHTAHEGFAVLLEEVDELWEAVRLKQSHPDRTKKILEESNQIAAMAMRIRIDCRDALPTQ